MTKITASTPNHKRKTYVRQLGDGVILEAEVSPCVFMNPGYPLQLTVTLRGPTGKFLGNVYPVDRTKNASNFTDATVHRLLAAVRVKPCRRCSIPAFDPASVETNRDGLCEPCFLAELNARWSVAAKSERQLIVPHNRHMKQGGMNFRVTAWVHPDDGDDYLLDWYFPVQPTAARIRKLLVEQHSAVLDDFEVIAL